MIHLRCTEKKHEILLLTLMIHFIYGPSPSFAEFAFLKLTSSSRAATHMRTARHAGEPKIKRVQSFLHTYTLHIVYAIYKQKGIDVYIYMSVVNTFYS